MIRLHKLIASVCGIGFVKGGGTVASIVTCIIWYFTPAGSFNDYRQLFFTVVVCVVGTWSSDVVDAVWGHDSNKVVIDEVAGMMLTLLFIPVEVKYLAAGLILFRFFDISKVLFVRRMELLPKGYGVMADDVLAGVYAHVVLWAIVKYELLNWVK